jgi:L-aspartate oxidase
LIAAPDSRPLQLPQISSNRPSNANQLDVADIRNSVQSLMWRWVGVQRSDKKLAEALDELRTYSRYVLPHVFEHEQGWELQNLLTTALLMAEAAWQRKESRGVHLRVDFPELSQQWHRHLYFQRTDD